MCHYGNFGHFSRVTASEAVVVWAAAMVPDPMTRLGSKKVALL